jgi:hypothetical protein
MKLKCANSRCNHVTELPGNILPKKIVCPACHILNTPQPETAGSSENVLDCILPEGFEFLLPTGIIQSPLGDLYVSPDDGMVLTRLEWIEGFGYDPKPVLEEMRKRGSGGVPGYVNLSTLGRKKR